MRSEIQTPANWTANAIAANHDWIHHFTVEELKEIDAALRHAQSRGISFETMRKEDFPLPTVSHVFAQGLQQLEDGVGMQHYRGIDTKAYSKQEMRLIYWAFGLHLGTPLSQSMNGDVLGDVLNRNTDLDGPTGRGYTSNRKLGCHTDSCDVVALFVMRTAKEGGASKLASSVAVHNEILRKRPDLLEVLYQPFYWSWQGQEAPGAKPYYPQPVFTQYNGKFACRYVRTHITSAQRYEEVPRLTPQQIEALDLLDSLSQSEQFSHTMLFEPGDMQLLNNHVTLHARTEFVDYEDMDKKRHLLRMWLATPNSRDLSPELGYIYRNLNGGTVRGGFPSRTGKHIYETRIGEAMLD